MNSRAKGKRGELEAAKALRDLLGLPAERGARNGVAGGQDIMGIPSIHFEVKRRRVIGACRFVDQAEADREPDQVPAVLMREDLGDWLVVVPMRHLDQFMAAIYAQRA